MPDERIYFDDTACWFGKVFIRELVKYERRYQKLFVTALFRLLMVSGTILCQFMVVKRRMLVYGLRRYYYCLEPVLEEALLVKTCAFAVCVGASSDRCCGRETRVCLSKVQYWWWFGPQPNMRHSHFGGKRSKCKIKVWDRTSGRSIRLCERVEKNQAIEPFSERIPWRWWRLYLNGSEGEFWANLISSFWKGNRIIRTEQNSK